MPRVSFFYGISIYMYWRDHAPAHFHAQYGEYWASIAIEDGRMLEGSLPPRASRLVDDWRRAHVGELNDNWLRVQRPEPTSTIEPLL